MRVLVFDGHWRAAVKLLPQRHKECRLIVVNRGRSREEAEAGTSARVTSVDRSQPEAAAEDRLSSSSRRSQAEDRNRFDHRGAAREIVDVPSWRIENSSVLDLSIKLKKSRLTSGTDHRTRCQACLVHRGRARVRALSEGTRHTSLPTGLARLSGRRLPKAEAEVHRGAEGAVHRARRDPAEEVHRRGDERRSSRCGRRTELEAFRGSAQHRGEEVGIDPSRDRLGAEEADTQSRSSERREDGRRGDGQRGDGRKQGARRRRALPSGQERREDNRRAAEVPVGRSKGRDRGYRTSKVAEVHRSDRKEEHRSEEGSLGAEVRRRVRHEEGALERPEAEALHCVQGEVLSNYARGTSRESERLA